MKPKLIKVDAAPKRGRPATGRRSDPDYAQHSIWLPIALYRRTVIKLGVDENGKRREFSGLVEQLLKDWVRE